VGRDRFMGGYRVKTKFLDRNVVPASPKCCGDLITIEPTPMSSSVAKIWLLHVAKVWLDSCPGDISRSVGCLNQTSQPPCLYKLCTLLGL